MPAGRINTTYDSIERKHSWEEPTWFFLERYNDAFVEEERRFVRAVLTGEPVDASGDDGLQAVRIAKAAQKSLELGRPVKMDEIGE